MDLHIEGLEPMHFILAYAGMTIHILMKLAEVFNKPDFTWRNFVLQNIISTLVSIVGIPVLLIVATDKSIKDVLPINYVTAMLAGWQTQSLFKTVFAMYNRKNNISDDSNNNQPPTNTPG